MSTSGHNLDTFRILFIIKGILSLMISFLPFLYILFGVFLFGSEPQHTGEQGIAGIIIMSVGSFIFFFLVALGILTLLAGKFLGERRRYDFIFVMAIINCFTGILGILLGIFTLLELGKPEVKRLFGKA